MGVGVGTGLLGQTFRLQRSYKSSQKCHHLLCCNQMEAYQVSMKYFTKPLCLVRLPSQAGSSHLSKLANKLKSVMFGFFLSLYLVPSPKRSGPYPTVRFTVVFFIVTLRNLPRLNNSASQIYWQCDLCASHFARIQIS